MVPNGVCTICGLRYWVTKFENIIGDLLIGNTANGQGVNLLGVNLFDCLRSRLQAKTILQVRPPVSNSIKSFTTKSMFAKMSFDDNCKWHQIEIEKCFWQDPTHRWVGDENKSRFFGPSLLLKSSAKSCSIERLLLPLLLLQQDFQSNNDEWFI